MLFAMPEVNVGRKNENPFFFFFGWGDEYGCRLSEQLLNKDMKLSVLIGLNGYNLY